MRILLALCLILTLQACGSKPVYIADEVRFSTDIYAGIVSVEFDLNKDYFIPQSKSQRFDELGKVWLNFDQAAPQSSLGAEIKPELLISVWPGEKIATGKNASGLRDFLDKNSLLAWNNNSQGLIYAQDSKLNYGGIFQDSRFSELPQNFLAIQDFKDDRGILVAKIAILGPFSSGNQNYDGGLLYFAIMGDNPFLTANTEIPVLKSFRMKARESSQISPLGFSDYFQMMFLHSRWLKFQESWKGSQSE